MSLIYLVITFVTTLILVIFLLRAGAARPMTVWALAAILPVLAAMSAAFLSQARAARVLREYVPADTEVALLTQGQEFRLNLNAQDAACVERAVRLHSEVDLVTTAGAVPLRKDSTIQGNLPPSHVVDALDIRGQLHCPNLKSIPRKER